MSPRDYTIEAIMSTATKNVPLTIPPSVSTLAIAVNPNSTPTRVSNWKIYKKSRIE
jgi:hypothetical protein